MLTSIMLSPMAFFDVTPSGRILNRFSKDMDVSKYSTFPPGNPYETTCFSGYADPLLYRICCPVLHDDPFPGWSMSHSSLQSDCLRFCLFVLSIHILLLGFSSLQSSLSSSTWWWTLVFLSPRNLTIWWSLLSSTTYHPRCLEWTLLEVLQKRMCSREGMSFLD